jgi:hypothetical protein
MKKLFLIAVFVVSANIAFAQDKYEFMAINYQIANPSLIAVSIDGVEFSKEKVSLPKESNDVLNINPLLLKVKEYQDKGWEIVSFHTATGSYYFHIAYLRKKKN